MPSELRSRRPKSDQPVQILVPIAGTSPFFSPDEYPFPKPLIEVGGVMMIERVINNLKSIGPDAEFIFVVRQQDVAQFSLDNTLKLLCPTCQIVALKNPTKGALCSALLSIDRLKRDAPLVIANGDQLIDDDLEAIVWDFRTTKASAGVITFRSTHPRWSYVRIDDGQVVEAVEKRVISDTAIAGFYYFGAAQTFIDAALSTVISGNSVDGSYFVAPSLNEVILAGGKVKATMLEASDYSSFYSPAKVHEFEQKVLMTSDSATNAKLSDVRLIVPAAGEGSRFRKAGYPKPKPFIDVLGRPMIQHVIDNVTPRGASIHLLLRSEHLREEPDTVTRLLSAGHRIHPVDKLTEGTACTLLLARSAFDDDMPMLVANSDQLVEFSVDDYVQDCFDRKLDGSILVFRDAELNPKWSFAKVDADGIVTEVAEKKPISDLATVGVYFFRRGSQFVKAAIDMIAQNDRVNNEFYTCPVYNYMIRNGCRVGIYEVPATAMHGLGTPEDLDAYLTRQTAASKKKPAK